MKTAIYIRYSTADQTEMQQMNTIEEYLQRQGLTADIITRDEGVSGGVSFTDRKLIKMLDELNEGDKIVVSEISRLGRSMSDLNKLVNDELKPRKLKLAVIKMGLELDCSNLKAIDEMILQSFAFSAQIEKEMIQERTQAALDAKRKRGEAMGGDIEVWGKKQAHVKDLSEDERAEYRENCLIKAQTASAETRRAKAMANPHNKAFWYFMEDYIKITQATDKIDYEDAAKKLNERGLKTPSGLEFNRGRVAAMYSTTKKIFKLKK